MSAPGPGHPLGPADRDAAFAPLHGASHILVAVSGGPDSVALLGLLAEWTAGRPAPHLSAATVDHRLRPEAAAEADTVAGLCARLGIPHATLAWERSATEPRSQEAARRARYRLLLAEAARVGASHLATAHHADDQAETLLMRMAAGSGLSGLSGMRPLVRRGGVAHVRPLLSLPKARLVATCRARSWPFAVDPANAAERFARARWRRLAPLLAAEGLDPARLGALAARVARADAALAECAAAALARARRAAEAGGLHLDMAMLAAEPDEIGLRALALAVSTLRAEADDASFLRLDRLETCHAALVAAVRAARPLRRTLAGCVVTLSASGHLIVTAEGPRRRGRRETLTLPATEPPRSLGMEARRT